MWPKFPSRQLLQVSPASSAPRTTLLSVQSCVTNIVKDDEQTVPCAGFTSESTTTTSGMSVTNVEKPSYVTITSPSIRKYTLVQYERWCGGFLGIFDPLLLSHSDSAHVYHRWESTPVWRMWKVLQAPRSPDCPLQNHPSGREGLAKVSDRYKSSHTSLFSYCLESLKKNVSLLMLRFPHRYKTAVHQCEVCKKEFKGKSSLEMHFRTHSGMKTKKSISAFFFKTCIKTRKGML